MKCIRPACRNKITGGAKQRRYCTTACSMAVRQERFWRSQVKKEKLPTKGQRA